MGRSRGGIGIHTFYEQFFFHVSSESKRSRHWKRIMTTILANKLSPTYCPVATVHIMVYPPSTSTVNAQERKKKHIQSAEYMTGNKVHPLYCSANRCTLSRLLALPKKQKLPQSQKNQRRIFQEKRYIPNRLAT